MKLTVRDIQKRLSNLSESTNLKPSDTRIDAFYLNATMNEDLKDSIFCLENWMKIPESDKVTAVLNLFETVCEQGNENQIIRAAIKVSESVDKSRDAKQTRTYLKRKLGHIKSKISTRINNNLSKTVDAMNAAKKNFKNNANTLKNNAMNDVNRVTGKKEAAIEKACDMIYTECERNVHCDRIIENYNNLSKRFNVDKIIRENVSNGTYDTTMILCRLVDTYNMKNRIKVNAVMETMLYGMTKLGYDVETKDIIAATTDYYLNKPNGITECKAVLKSCTFFSEADIKSVAGYILENTKAEDEYKRKILCESFLNEFYDPALNSEYRVGQHDFSDYYGQFTLGPYGNANTYFNTCADNYRKSCIFFTAGLLKVWYCVYETLKSISPDLAFERFELKPINSHGRMDKFINSIYNSSLPLTMDGHTRLSSIQGTYCLIDAYDEDRLDSKDKCRKYIDIIAKEVDKCLKESGFDAVYELSWHGELALHLVFKYDNAKKIIEEIDKPVSKGLSDESMIESSIRNFASSTKKSTNKQFIREDSDLNDDKPDSTVFNKIVNDFKQQDENGKENKLKSLVTKLYTKNAGNIVEETPNFLEYLRGVFVLGSFAVNPICGAIVAIADQFVKLHLSRQESQKMLKAFESEIKKTEKKIESEKDDEKRERLESYLDSLNEAKDKINEYAESLLTDKEIDAKYDEDNSEENKDTFKSILQDENDKKKDNDPFGDFDNWDDEDDDFKIDESAMTAINIIPHVAAAARENYYDIIPVVREHIETIPSSMISNISYISTRLPEFVNPNEYKKMLESTLSDIRSSKITFQSIGKRYCMIDSINEALNTLDKGMKPIHCNDIYDTYTYMSAARSLYESIDIIKNAYDSYSPLLEMSFKNKLAMASEKLKRSLQGLSDKEKTASKNFDVSMNALTGAIERSFTNDNREAIIKGSILPSASKLLKMAIASGVVGVLVNPVIAVIGVLGYLGCSAKYSAKERQMVLDEIEIELKMVQKYLDIAESKNDLKATKELLTIQRNLERQRQRIKYKMNIKLDKIHDPKDTPTDGIDD
jgi:hypothetical protein